MLPLFPSWTKYTRHVGVVFCHVSQLSVALIRYQEKQLKGGDIYF